MELVTRGLNLNKFRNAYCGMKKDYDSHKNGCVFDFSKTFTAHSGLCPGVIA